MVIYHTLCRLGPLYDKCHSSVYNLHIILGRGRDPESKPDDWYDEFEITSMKDSQQTKSKGYQLRFEKSKTTNIGGNLGLKISGAGFFNMAAAPELGGGVSASRSKTTTESKTEESKEEESLSHGYQVKNHNVSYYSFT